MKKNIVLIYIIFLFFLIVGCSKTQQSNSKLIDTLPAYEEMQVQCNHIIETVYIDQEKKEINSCIICGNIGNGYVYYNDLDAFKKHCSTSTDGGIVNYKYNKTYSKLIIQLSVSYNYSCFILSEYVDEIILLGIPKPRLDDISIKFLYREKDVTVVFSELQLCSTQTVIDASSVSNNLNIKMTGSSNIIYTRTGKYGSNGGTSYNNRGQQYAKDGEDGGDASTVFISNGNINLYNYSATVIAGGDGGNGGNGGSLTAWITTGNGGYGGDGGDGADIFDANGRVSLYGDTENIVLTPGKGGKGGSGGENDYGNRSASGAKGSDGIVGN